MAFVQYTVGGTVCIVITSCSWSNGYGLMLQLGLGLGTGNAYFLYLK